MRSRRFSSSYLIKLETTIDGANSDYIRRLEREITALKENAVVARQMADTDEALRGQVTQATARAETAEALPSFHRGFGMRSGLIVGDGGG